VASSLTSGRVPLPAGFTVCFVDLDGCRRSEPLSSCWMVSFEQVLPVREFGSYRGKRSFSGLSWSCTVSDHVGYESWLERPPQRSRPRPRHHCDRTDVRRLPPLDSTRLRAAQFDAIVAARRLPHRRLDARAHPDGRRSRQGRLPPSARPAGSSSSTAGPPAWAILRNACHLHLADPSPPWCLVARLGQQGVLV
jgi:hypothetical protein